MSEPALSTPAAPAPPPSIPPAAPGLHLVRLPVDKPQAAVEFLRARSSGVMDLIAHFWEGLAQTGPLQRADFHLVGVVEDELSDKHINITTLDAGRLAGAMLYVPKAHRADVLALSATAAAALVSYICHLGARSVRHAAPISVEMGEQAEKTAEWGPLVPVLGLTDLTGRQAVVEMIPAEPPTKAGGAGGAGGTAANGGVGTGGSNGTALGGHAAGAGSNGTNGNGANNGGAGVPIDFLTGESRAIHWMTPLLLPLVHKRHPARQLTNVVMQLPPEVPCGLQAHVRPAKESDIPTLNRWRRLYKEERGILFDADMDALVHNQRVYVYELPADGGLERSTQAGATTAALAEAAVSGAAGGHGNVVAVAKIDLDLADLCEIGGVYTFSEYRQHGYSAALMADMAWRIRQAGKRPTLQVDEANLPALRLYEKLGWRAMGKLSRVWLTG